MRLKKYIAIMCLSGVVLSATACSGSTDSSVVAPVQVSIEDLLSNPYGVVELSYLDTNIKYDLGTKVSVEGQEDVNIDISMSVNNITTPKLMHNKGTVSITSLGDTQVLDLDMYTDSEFSYIFDMDNSCWLKQSLDASSSYDFSEFTNLDFNLLTDTEVTLKGDEYVVTGRLDMSSLGDNAMVSGVDLSSIVADITLHFDSENSILKAIDYDVATDGFEADGMSFTKFKLSIAVNEINGDNTLELPEGATNGVDTSDLDIIDNFEEPTDNQVSSDKKLCDMYFSSTQTVESISQFLSSYYAELPDEAVLESLIAILNSYTASEFMVVLDSYMDWDTYTLQALAYMYDLGIVDDEVLLQADVDQSYVKNLVEEYIKK